MAHVKARRTLLPALRCRLRPRTRSRLGQGSTELLAAWLDLNHANTTLRDLDAGGDLPPQLTSVFPSIADTLAHIYVADSMWLSVMSGDAFDKTAQIIQRSQNESRGISLEQMEGLFAGMAGAYRTVLHRAVAWTPIAPEHPRHGRLDEAFRAGPPRGQPWYLSPRHDHSHVPPAGVYQGWPRDYAFFLRERGSGGGAAGGAPA